MEIEVPSDASVADQFVRTITRRSSIVTGAVRDRDEAAQRLEYIQADDEADDDRAGHRPR